VFFGTCFFEELNGFHFSRGNYVNLSPLLSLVVENCLDHFLLSKIDVLWHFFFGKLCGFHLLGGSYLKLSPLLSSIVGNCFDYFLFFLTLVFFGTCFLKNLMVFICQKGVM
jgi:hypothetical protein